jgi:hypothetical protein
MLVALATHHRRVHESGQALCLLGVRRSRMLVFLSATALAVIFIGGASPVAGMALAGAAACLWAATACRAWRSRAVGTRPTMGAARDAVRVHSVASIRRGAGAEVLQKLTEEADQKGWSLFLDAANTELARYYLRFGFRATATAPMRTGRDRVRRSLRMWRHPSPARDGNDCGGPDA